MDTKVPEDAICAFVHYTYKDDAPEKIPFGAIVSFGEYIEETESDSNGIDDLDIIFYIDKKDFFDLYNEDNEHAEFYITYHDFGFNVDEDDDIINQ